MESLEKYTHHLYALVKGQVEFVAQKNIYTQSKKIVVNVGDTIPETFTHKFPNKKLLHPIEECVRLKQQMTTETLYEKACELVEESPSLTVIDRKFCQHSMLKACCKLATALSTLNELFTLFSICMPELFNQSLQIAYLGCVYGTTEKLEKSDIEALFLAGLIHDIGLAFISRKIIYKKGKYTSAEWGKVQLHPIIAYKMLGLIENFPEKARRAILDHHECSDGSGYCYGKTGNEIDRFALIISILDDIFVIYKKKLVPIGRNIADVVPTIQMNTHDYPKDILFPALTIIKSVTPSEVKTINLKVLQAIIEYTYQQQLYINKFYDILNEIDKVLETNESREYFIIKNQWKKLSGTIISSGVNESSYVEWLSRLENVDEWVMLYTEIDHKRLMLEEVAYQIKSYYHLINDKVSEKKSELAQIYSMFIHVFSVTEEPSVPITIKNFWNSKPYK